jgi:hypothetical protein
MPIGSAVVPGSSPRPGRGRCSEPRSAARYLGHGAAARRNRAGNRPGRTSAGEPRWASTGRLIASRSDALSRTDPHTLVTPEEAAEAGLIAERLARAIRYRLCRRRTPARRREMIDIRRTIRRNLSRRRTDRTAAQASPGTAGQARGAAGRLRIDVYLPPVLPQLRARPDRPVAARGRLLVSHPARANRRCAARARPDVAMARLSLMADGFGGGTRMVTAPSRPSTTDMRKRHSTPVVS